MFQRGQLLVPPKLKKVFTARGNRAPEFNTDTVSLYAESMRLRDYQNHDYPLILIDVSAYEGEDRDNGRQTCSRK